MKEGRCLGEGRRAQVYEWGTGEVIKLFFDGHSAKDELKKMEIVHKLGVASPEVTGLVTHKGRQGIVYRQMEGKTMLRTIRYDSDSLTHYAAMLAELHVALHQVEGQGLGSSLELWKGKIRKLSKLTDEEKEGVLALLDRMPVGNALCHHDFRPDNVLMTEKGPVIIDWADAAADHPLSDVMRTSLMLESHVLPPGPCPVWLMDRNNRLFFHQAYLEEYRKRSGIAKEELDAWAVPIAAARLSDGFPSEAQPLLRVIQKGLAAR